MRKWTWLAVVTLGVAWAYLLDIFFLGEVVFGVPVRGIYLAPTVFVSFVATYWVVQWLVRRQLLSPIGRVKAPALRRQL